MAYKLSFTTLFNEESNTDEVIPEVNGALMTDLIHRFEKARGLETRSDDTYAGLIPRFFRFGPVHGHFLAAETAHLWKGGKVPLLGCSCGEVGCWPLLARILVDGTTVTWTDFEQPHRPERDYSTFGPFTFERIAYEVALSTLAPLWNEH